MTNFIFLITHEDQLELLHKFLHINVPNCRENILEPNTNLPSWLAQYHPKSSNYRHNKCSLPAFIGWGDSTTSHQPLDNKSADQIFNSIFKGHRKVLPLEILTNPQDYPEYYI